MANPLEVKKPSSGSQGDNVILPTNTTLVYTVTTDMIPTITQSITATTHSDILLERQKVLESDCYALLGYIMTNGIANVIETLNQHQDLYKFYQTLKGFIKSLNS